MIETRNSDAVRRASLKKQKEAFREKELLIKKALNSVDGSVNKKIIFDDSICDQEDNHAETKVNRSKKRTLFDDDDGEAIDSGEEFDFSENKKAKTVNLGNDPRFTVDERFLNEEDPNQEQEKNKSDEDEDELTTEKKQQLEILQSVLGKPLPKKNPAQVTAKRKSQMIRYDPTQEDHQKHELQKEEAKPSKKKKRAAREATAEEEKPIPVSTETFYSVSENLTETLKAPEEFSLLQRFGTAPPEKTHDANEDKQASDRKSKLGENFNARNPFRYDSSDDEGETQEENGQNARVNEEKVASSVEETFFLNPSVFKEAEEFFKIPAPSNESFKKLRKQLKEIVRTKIRRNIRKTQLWRRKKINQLNPRRK